MPAEGGRTIAPAFRDRFLAGRNFVDLELGDKGRSNKGSAGFPETSHVGFDITNGRGEMAQDRGGKVFSYVPAHWGISITRPDLRAVT